MAEVFVEGGGLSVCWDAESLMFVARDRECWTL